MKIKYEEVRLEKGVVSVYDFNDIKLHAYKTYDSINDEVFIIQKHNDVAVIEPASFKENIKELELYLTTNELEVKAIIPSYHMAGATFQPGTPVYSTMKADSFAHIGGAKAMIENFTQTFGDAFDSSIFSVTDYLKEGINKIIGIDFNIIATDDAFDIEIPEINVIYIHMLGSDTHSIITSYDQIDKEIEKLQNIVNKKYELILSSHHIPENLDDVESKISYFNHIKKFYDTANDEVEFRNIVKIKYPDYLGESYLDMSIAALYNL